MKPFHCQTQKLNRSVSISMFCLQRLKNTEHPANSAPCSHYTAVTERGVTRQDETPDRAGLRPGLSPSPERLSVSETLSYSLITARPRSHLNLR